MNLNYNESFFNLILASLALKAFSSTCFQNTYNLTFYVTGSVKDILICGTNAPTNAVLTNYINNGPPKLNYFWDGISGDGFYHCLMTKYFYVPGRPTGALVDVLTDDITTMKINDIEVSALSTTKLCVFHKNIDVFGFIQPGLNKLYIDACNTGGEGKFGYRLIIKTQLI